MSSPDSNEVKQKARSSFVYYLVIWIWKRVVFILIGGNILSALAIWIAPANARTGVSFKLMNEIGLPLWVVGAAFMLAAVLMFFQPTAIAGHFVSFLSYGWWTFLVFYIALLLKEPTTLISATWALTLGALHLLAAGARWTARYGYREVERKTTEASG